MQYSPEVLYPYYNLFSRFRISDMFWMTMPYEIKTSMLILKFCPSVETCLWSYKTDYVSYLKFHCVVFPPLLTFRTFYWFWKSYKNYCRKTDTAAADIFVLFNQIFIVIFFLEMLPKIILRIQHFAIVFQDKINHNRTSNCCESRFKAILYKRHIMAKFCRAKFLLVLNHRFNY